MALTSADETDLLLPLHRGVHESPRFATFLERLQRRTGAAHVGISLRMAGDPRARVTTFHAGLDLPERGGEPGRDALPTLRAVHGGKFRPGRVYSVSEFTDHDAQYRTMRQQTLEPLGIRDERVLRLPECAGFDAWLTVARSDQCTAADSALLSSLAPYVAAVAESLVRSERECRAAMLASEGLGRAGAGWILFDAEARVIEADPQTAGQLRALAGIAAEPGQRLRGIAMPAQRALAEASSELAGDPGRNARIVVLAEDPRIEALLLPAKDHDEALPQEAAMLAICRMPRARSGERADGLAAAFALPRREAELAIALSDGKSIAEAAEAMGLTLETARNYSKRLYAKVGVRGQAELVRAVYESGAVLA